MDSATAKFDKQIREYVERVFGTSEYQGCPLCAQGTLVPATVVETSASHPISSFEGAAIIPQTRRSFRSGYGERLHIRNSRLGYHPIIIGEVE